jgi:hypothetical protein
LGLLGLDADFSFAGLNGSANGTSDAHTRLVMLGIAQDYEKLAARAEQRALKPL